MLVNDTQDHDKHFGKDMESTSVVLDPEWGNNRNAFHSNYSLGRFGSKEYWTQFMQKSELPAFKKSAYASRAGYSIRTNPWTGHKELFIAGTRTGTDWMQNFAEGSGIIGPNISADISDSFTNNYVEHLEQVINDNNIEVVYGHSRGASIMSKIKSPKITKVGLDGASVIGEKDDYLNIIQSRST